MVKVYCVTVRIVGRIVGRIVILGIQSRTWCGRLARGNVREKGDCRSLSIVCQESSREGNLPAATIGIMDDHEYTIEISSHCVLGFFVSIGRGAVDRDGPVRR